MSDSYDNQDEIELFTSSPAAKQQSEQTHNRNADLVDQIKEYADKMDNDGASRGDLKILARTMRELRYAFKVYSQYRDRRKVTVFGSARTSSDDPDYQQAVDFGSAMAEQDWMVITGAANGIMEAGHRGAGREHSMGLNILLPFEQESNEVIRGDQKLVHMKYFFTRKLMFVKECHAFVCLPGGFGTLDEALEVLTLLQTGKRDMVPLVLLNAPHGDYWTRFDEFVRAKLLEKGMISPDDLALYKVTNSCDEAVEEVLSFFRVFHSMRYVRNELVLRLQEELHPSLLADINKHFADILADGEFEATTALEQEDEPELEDLPRLKFHFNRRSLGRLRMLVDAINRGSIGE